MSHASASIHKYLPFSSEALSRKRVEMYQIFINKFEIQLEQIGYIKYIDLEEEHPSKRHTGLVFHKYIVEVLSEIEDCKL
jgi:hypothetical protein